MAVNVLEESIFSEITNMELRYWGFVACFLLLGVLPIRGNTGEFMEWRGEKTGVVAVISGAHFNTNKTIGLQIKLINHGKEIISFGEMGIGSGFYIMAWNATGNPLHYSTQSDNTILGGSLKRMELSPDNRELSYPNIEMPISKNLTYPFYVQVIKSIGDDRSKVLSAPTLIYKKNNDNLNLFALSLPGQVDDLFTNDGKAARQNETESATVQPEQTPPENAEKPMARNAIFNASRELGKDNLRHLLLC